LHYSIVLQYHLYVSYLPQSRKNRGSDSFWPWIAAARSNWEEKASHLAAPVCSHAEFAMDLSMADQVNQQMVDRLITEGALWSVPVIAAFRATPRHRFLDRVFQYSRKSERWKEIITRDPGREELRIVYSDRALITHLSAPHGQEAGFPTSSSSQPSLMAQMLEDLDLSPGQRVLEVGAGTGYNAALLAHIVGPERVITVDVDRDVLSEAWDHLRGFPERKVELKHADGRHGFAEGAPYDRIMVTAATPDLELAWIEQLTDSGQLLAPLSLAPGLAFLVRGGMKDGIFQGRLTRAAYFMTLRAENEMGTYEVPPEFPTGDLTKIPAPWARWFDRRRPRINWIGFVQSLAFYGWLRGFGVHYQVQPDSQPCFGISDADRKLLCWFGPHHWLILGEESRTMGWNLWRDFLDAGGPWPTEYKLQARFTGGLQSSGPNSFLRQGPRCQQLWQMMEKRERPAWI
jgi:protein-L-isoaspartate(D-aspartate) O-methyltransferase